MNIDELIKKYINNGYKNDGAISKVAQDIILLKISKSKFSDHITLKGGVVMHSISKDVRRATRDMDLDFIKYSLEDYSIKDFINKLNKVDDGISIKINGEIEKLHHQDYDGKRVNIVLTDQYNYKIDSKLDIGVHKFFDIKQDEYCFDLDMFGESVNLLINSKEQIFVEKLKSLLKFGITSTRYKDVFDFYYLINNETLDKDKLLKYISILIFNDSKMKENNIIDINKRLSSILNNNIYKRRLNSINNNWLELPIEKVIDCVLIYINKLEMVEI